MMWRITSEDVRYVKKNKFTGPYVKTPFQETDSQYQPWDKLYLDIVGPLPMTEEGYKYILTSQDNLSKYLLATPMITQTADEVALTFLRYEILYYGIPNSIVTYQGSHFCVIFLNGYVNYLRYLS